MKTYNIPAQARSLREIEVAAMAPIINVIKEVNAPIKPDTTPVETQKEEGGATQKTKATPKKGRSKKNTTEV